MLTLSLALAAFAFAQADTTPPADTAAHAAPAPVVQFLAPTDTGPRRPRPRAIEYSDAYFTRLQIHRWGSYTMLPLFAAEYSLGQNLLQDAHPATWLRPAHGVVAAGIGALFTINTITGVWNLWDSRADPSNRTLRFAHSALMLASDAGFAWAGATGSGHFHSYPQEQRHKRIAIGSIALSTAGTAIMWLWNR